MVNPSRRRETGSVSENPSESNSGRNKVEKEPKKEVVIQTTVRDRNKRIRGSVDSGNGKEKVRKVVDVCMYTVRLLSFRTGIIKVFA